MRTPSWGPIQKLRFVGSYAWSKLFLFAHIRSPRTAVYAFEWKYSLVNLVNSIFGTILTPVKYRGPGRIDTDCGSFEVRAGSQDAAIISPGFEAGDQKFLSRLLKTEFANEPFDFLDVGANIGAFSVRVGLQAPRARGWAFEPVADNLRMLRTNLRLNSLNDFHVMPFALGESRHQVQLEFLADRPGDSRIGGENRGGEMHEIEVRRADEELKDLGSKLLIKIDVEGHETQVLNGMAGILSSPGRETWLCIEDIAFREDLYLTLRGMKFEFVTKRTPYNSWWRKRGGP